MYVKLSQQAHDEMITPLLRQNDVATSFRRNDDVIIMSCVRWAGDWFAVCRWG